MIARATQVICNGVAYLGNAIRTLANQTLTGIAAVGDAVVDAAKDAALWIGKQVSGIWESITSYSEKNVCDEEDSSDGDAEDGKTAPTPSVGYPGNDPDKKPGDDWEWRGPKDKGSWYNPKTGETLHPDLNHPAPEGPHWDYIPRKNGSQYRWYPDGTIIPK